MLYRIAGFFILISCLSDAIPYFTMMYGTLGSGEVTATAAIDDPGEDDPNTIHAVGNSPDCAFSVLFQPGTHYPGRPDLPNGPSTIQVEGKDGEQLNSIGLGFTVSGTVIGGIGNRK